METDELVDHLSAIAKTVTKEVISWLTRTPLLWPCTSGFRSVWEDGGTLHSGHAVSFILTCMQPIPVRTFSSFLVLCPLLLLNLFSRTSFADVPLETWILLASRAAGREDHTMSTEGPAWPLPGLSLLIHIVELTCNVNISKRNAP